MTMAELVGNKILIERAKAGKTLGIIREISEEIPETFKNFESEIPNQIPKSGGSGDNNFEADFSSKGNSLLLKILRNYKIFNLELNFFLKI